MPFFFSPTLPLVSLSHCLFRLYLWSISLSFHLPAPNGPPAGRRWHIHSPAGLFSALGQPRGIQEGELSSFQCWITPTPCIWQWRCPWSWNMSSLLSWLEPTEPGSARPCQWRRQMGDGGGCSVMLFSCSCEDDTRNTGSNSLSFLIFSPSFSLEQEA